MLCFSQEFVPVHLPERLRCRHLDAVDVVGFALGTNVSPLALLLPRRRGLLAVVDVGAWFLVPLRLRHLVC